MLLTQFRLSREKGTIPVFLLDEPASNLHQTAQQRLLKALGELRRKADVSVIYTTHSHHLIDPERLESTYVVMNRALDYEKDDDYTSNMTDVAIERYRAFVGNNPNQTTYFQPILDVLDYRPSNLENVPDVVMTEGKYDFYSLGLAQLALEVAAGEQLNVMPGGGAGGLEDPIKLYLAWGRNFVVLLDGDTEGRDQKRRYEDVLGPAVADRIVTLDELGLTGKPRRMEDLFVESDKKAIQSAKYPSAPKHTKRHFNLAVQEKLVAGDASNLSEATLDNFRNLLAVLREKLKPPTNK